MADSQLLKGILEGCVLGIISQKETYGYEILSVLEAKGLPDLGEGTLYPLLTRLNKNGLISCRKAKSPLGPIRQYYQLTPAGQERLEVFRQEFVTVTRCTLSILGENEHEFDKLVTKP